MPANPNPSRQRGGYRRARVQSRFLIVEKFTAIFGPELGDAELTLLLRQKLGADPWTLGPGDPDFFPALAFAPDLVKMALL
jgi:hypothetical protein